MELLLYKNFSKRKNSTKQPSEATATKAIVTKSPTSVESPVFEIAAPVDLDYNYAKWAGHYYFIDDIVLSINGRYEIHCTQDVLATYKTEIGNLSAFVARSASEHDITLNDMSVAPSDYFVQHEEPYITPEGYDSAGVYLVRFANGYEEPYIFTKEQWNKYLNAISVYSQFADFWKYIISITWAPFSRDTLQKLNVDIDLQIGLVNFTQVLENAEIEDVKLRLAKKFVGFYLKDLPVPTSYYNDFRDYDPRFTSCTVRIFGSYVPINPEFLRGALKYTYVFDTYTGQAVIDLSYEDHTFTSFTKNIGVPISVTGTTSNLGSIMTSIGGSALGILAGASTGGVAGAAVAAVGAGISAANVAVQSMAPSAEVVGSAGSFADSTWYNTIPMIVMRKSSTDIDNEHEGKPLCKIRTLNTLSGYIKCANASIEIAGLGNDKTQVDSYLNGGFYYE